MSGERHYAVWQLKLRGRAFNSGDHVSQTFVVAPFPDQAPSTERVSGHLVSLDDDDDDDERVSSTRSGTGPSHPDLDSHGASSPVSPPSSPASSVFHFDQLAFSAEEMALMLRLCSDAVAPTSPHLSDSTRNSIDNASGRSASQHITPQTSGNLQITGPYGDQDSSKGTKRKSPSPEGDAVDTAQAAKRRGTADQPSPTGSTQSSLWEIGCSEIEEAGADSGEVTSVVTQSTTPPLQHTSLDPEATSTMLGGTNSAGHGTCNPRQVLPPVSNLLSRGPTAYNVTTPCTSRASSLDPPTQIDPRSGVLSHISLKVSPQGLETLYYLMINDRLKDQYETKIKVSTCICAFPLHTTEYRFWAES